MMKLVENVEKEKCRRKNSKRKMSKRKNTKKENIEKEKVGGEKNLFVARVNIVNLLTLHIEKVRRRK